jgi:hypothetical protein
VLFRIYSFRDKQLKKNQTPFEAALGCTRLPVSSGGSGQAATRHPTRACRHCCKPVALCCGGRSLSPMSAAVGNGSRIPLAVANGGSRLVVQMLNPTIYFCKIKEKISTPKKNELTRKTCYIVFRSDDHRGRPRPPPLAPSRPAPTHFHFYP